MLSNLAGDDLELNIQYSPVPNQTVVRATYRIYWCNFKGLRTITNWMHYLEY